MAEGKNNSTKNIYIQKFGDRSGPGSIIYFLGVIGALIYYFQIADTFWLFILGILKALVWPAFLVYEVLRFLGAY